MKRIVYLDWLRIYAIIAVVTIHISSWTVAINLYDHYKSYWLTGNLFESLSRSSVPLFVMISGTLLLSSEKNFTYYSFLKKRINKIFLPLLGWSLIYYIYKYQPDLSFFSVKEFGNLFLTNGISVHFWFMYMILGLYLITPLVKILASNAAKKDLQYFLILWVLSSVIFKLIQFIFDINIQLELYFVTNYVGYFVLGYYLSKFEVTKNWRIISYIGAFIGLMLTFFLTLLYTIENNGDLAEFWYEYHSPNVFLISIGLFIFIKYNLSDTKIRVPKTLDIINNTSFGIYLVHLLVMRIFSPYILNYIFYNLHPIFSIPINVILTIIISSIIALFIKRVPLLKKLIP